MPGRNHHRRLALGKYLGEDAFENGIKACISTWHRPAPNTFPSLAKACGNYLNSQLIKMEALQHGYDEGIALSTEGYVTEGSGGKYIFSKRRRVVHPAGQQLHIIRHHPKQRHHLSKRNGLYPSQTKHPRELLYLADEVFMTGTAAEITPVSHIDGHPIGKGKRGDITQHIQKAYFDILAGEKKDQHGWLTFVD